MRPRASLVAIAALCALGACLPSETRPEPGTVVYTLSGADATLRGVQSADGWSIEFSKFLIGTQGVPTNASSECVLYAIADMPTLVNVRVPGKHEVDRVLALGECGFSFWAWALARGEGYDNSEIEEWFGPGVTDQDLALLESRSAGVYVEGKATRAAVTKVFRWTLFVSDFCGWDWDADESLRPTVRVRSGATERVDLSIHGDHLFFDRLDGSGVEVRFDPVAEADANPAYGNADGEVTREELSRVPLSTIERPDGVYLFDPPLDLATWIDMLAGRMAHLGGAGPCSPFEQDRSQ